MLYTREPGGPVLSGDIMPEGEVVGFAFHPSPFPDSTNDLLLLTKDRDAVTPPGRPVPESAGDALELAPAPALRLEPERLRAAGAIDDALPRTMARLLRLPGRPWTPVAVDLVETIGRGRHDVWLVGGATRDTISGDGEVGDLDLAGTAPTGRFSQIARGVRVRLGLEAREKVSPDSLVCWASVRPGGGSLYEYRALNMNGWPFPVSCSDIAQDAECRDLTINSIYYDPRHADVLDPVGGLDDLTDVPRRLLSRRRPADAEQQAVVLLRALKFLLRWERLRELDTTSLSAWVSTLPGDWEERLTAAAWREASELHAHYVVDAPAELQLRLAGRLGPAAVELVRELLGGAS